MTDNHPLTTRDRILAAAIAMVRESSGSRLSVRAVATRAGVGMGTLRYYFGTQRALLDAVFASIYEEALPDGGIRNASIAPQERLLACCRHMLNPVGLDDQAREVWTSIFRTFIDPRASPEHRNGYLEIKRQALRRVESWLSILVEEEALARGDNTARARFLLVVLDGLALQRALPSETALLEPETSLLEMAIAALPFAR